MRDVTKTHLLRLAGRVVNAPDGAADGNIAVFDGDGGKAIKDSGIGAGNVWHAGNDGPGSGLDADTLDGIHASEFARKIEEATVIQAGTHTYTLHDGYYFLGMHFLNTNGSASYIVGQRTHSTGTKYNSLLALATQSNVTPTVSNGVLTIVNNYSVAITLLKMGSQI